MNKEHTLFVEKYRPDTLEGYIGNDHFKAKLQQFIESGDVPHLILNGRPGTGKTTAAKIIIKNIECDYLFINASDENNIETVRTRIKNFASTMSFKPMKIVVLDEADYITRQAQAALRNLMEVFSKNCRFILTCNYIENIIEPLISRSQVFELTPPSKVEVAKHIYGILQKENITVDKKDLVMLVDAYYPDIRRILNTAQREVVDGVLSVKQDEIISSDYKLKVVEILKGSGQPKSKITDIRQLIADNKIRDFTQIYRLLYDRITEYAPNAVAPTIIAIGEGQFKDSSVIDKEINFVATIVQILSNLQG
jgi:DNA polymerase III delta prime subunit